MKCFRYGTVKDWVLSVKVVLADGTIVKFGEPLPKNRVGYDFVHLMCGSEGTLGLITEAWVKINTAAPKKYRPQATLCLLSKLVVSRKLSSCE